MIFSICMGTLFFGSNAQGTVNPSTITNDLNSVVVPFDQIAAHLLEYGVNQIVIDSKLNILKAKNQTFFKFNNFKMSNQTVTQNFRFNTGLMNSCSIDVVAYRPSSFTTKLVKISLQPDQNYKISTVTIVTEGSESIYQEIICDNVQPMFPDQMFFPMRDCTFACPEQQMIANQIHLPLLNDEEVNNFFGQHSDAANPTINQQIEQLRNI